MNEKIIISRVIDALSEIDDCQVQSSMDFAEQRQDNMVVVGITNTEQLNVGCDVPDYAYSLQILINCGIPEDDEADKFYDIISEVKRRLLPVELNQKALPAFFGNLPVVAFFFQNQNYSTAERSNICTLNYRIIASY